MLVLPVVLVLLPACQSGGLMRHGVRCVQNGCMALMLVGAGACSDRRAHAAPGCPEA